jgi:hypothetical protein
MELPGDQSMSKQKIMATQLIFNTPEKRSFAQLVCLVSIGEVHLTEDPCWRPW